MLFFSLLEQSFGTITEPGLPVVKLSKGISGNKRKMS